MNPGMAPKASAKLRTIEARDTVDAVSAVDQVMEAVKDGIRQARYVPGQRLVEPDMMRDFAVSRGTVREALRRLAAEGFVQIELYRGASIRKMSRATNSSSSTRSALCSKAMPPRSRRSA